ncbi:hypothetical protein OS493_001265 [Desmophyllum pertusum]|uniref:Uncharacterized protein n=1 Tax=Desmophyllum pertusum TaxID=174260 RepID=A0A9X0D6Z9_9CNID|nr:hypothetical protein OS493_001265 [Desmophyllum pertusum]
MSVNAGSKIMALVDAPLQDVAYSILLKKKNERQLHQIPAVGRGPTATELNAREKQHQAARAELGASPLFSGTRQHELLEPLETRDKAIKSVDPRSSHRSDKKNEKENWAVRNWGDIFE